MGGYGDDRVIALIKQLKFEYHLIVKRYNLMLRAGVSIHSSSSNLGSWNPKIGEISISLQLIDKYNWGTVVEVLKHEIAHQVVDERYSGTHRPHGECFQHVCELLEVEPWARRASLDFDSLPEVKTKESSKLLERARQLLELTKSSNPHEASLAMKKVNDLYDKHYIKELLNQKDGHAVFEKILVETKYKRVPIRMSFILDILEEFFNVSTVMVDLYSARYLGYRMHFYLMGKRENVEIAEYLLHFLDHKAEELWKKRRLRGSGALFRNSFYMGLFAGLEEKLRADQAERRSDSEVKALIVQDNKFLDEFVVENFPKLTKTTSRFQGSSELGEYDSGLEQGRKLDIHWGLKGKGEDNDKEIKGFLN